MVVHRCPPRIPVVIVAGRRLRPCHRHRRRLRIPLVVIISSSSMFSYSMSGHYHHHPPPLLFPSPLPSPRRDTIAISSIAHATNHNNNIWPLGPSGSHRGVQLTAESFLSLSLLSAMSRLLLSHCYRRRCCCYLSFWLSDCCCCFYDIAQRFNNTLSSTLSHATHTQRDLGLSNGAIPLMRITLITHPRAHEGRP